MLANTLLLKIFSIKLLFEKLFSYSSGHYNLDLSNT
jgi:hypothetical protein